MQHLLDRLPTSLEDRLVINELCRLDSSFRAQVREKCEEDGMWFVNAFCWTYHPKDEDGDFDQPFILWDIQMELWDWLEERLATGTSGIIFKTREMGASWVTIAWQCWHWLFDRNYLTLMGSRKEDLVDSKDQAALFWKVRYLLQSIPSWLLPEEFDFDGHVTHMAVIRPDSHNQLMGESANSNFGRAGRYTTCVYDEMAFWMDIANSWSAARSSARCRIALSTADGHNEFEDMVKSGNYAIFRMPWHRHPDRDEDWLETERKEYHDAAKFAREVLMSFEESMTGRVYADLVSEIPRGYFPYKKGMPLYTSWDVGLDGTAIIWWAINPKTMKPIMVDSYSNRNQPIDFYVPLITGKIPPDWKYQKDYEALEIEKITRHATWPLPLNFGDPSIRQRSVQTGLTVYDVLKTNGIIVHSHEGSNRFIDRKLAADVGLAEIEGINEPDCIPVVEALEQARYPERKKGSKFTSAVANPIHDESSHFRTAVEYFFINWKPKRSTTSRPQSYRREMAYQKL